MTRALATITAAATIVATIQPAAAHAFGARYDLPLPLGFFLGAAALAVAISFVAAVALMRKGSVRRLTWDLSIPAWLSTAVGGVMRWLGLATLALLLATSFFGPPEATRNLATVAVWVIWWVGFVLISGLVVELWPAIDPFRTAHRLVARLAGRNPESGVVPLPRLAAWLAPAGLLVIAWVELVSDWSEDPRTLGVMILLYLVVSLAAGAAFGMRWFREADPLGRLFELLGRMAPIAWRPPATLRLRPPGEGLLQETGTRTSEVAIVVCLIGMVLFDGFSETPAWAAVLDAISRSEDLRGALLWLRGAGVDLLKLTRTLGLITIIGLFAALYLALVWSMRWAARSDTSIAEFASTFATTLLPIAIAYHLSHYVSYLLIAGQLIVPALSDPFGAGWDLFGTAQHRIDIGVIGAKQVWWIAVVVLVGGHALSVLSGHRRAIAVFGRRGGAAASQLPMTAAMVALTASSLWILAQPIIE